MEVLQALDDLSDVETGSLLAEARVVLVYQVDVIPSGDGGQVSVFFFFTVYISCSSRFLIYLSNRFQMSVFRRTTTY